LGIIITILGVGMAALPTGIIAAGFTSELRRRREHFEFIVRNSLMEGGLDKRNRHDLELKHVNLGISRADAMRIIRHVTIDVKKDNTVPRKYCPHCGERL